jgi:hypothetical protein
MFGLILKSTYDNDISKLKHEIEVEKCKSAYWELKCKRPDIEPIILGEEQDILEIKGREKYGRNM